MRPLLALLVLLALPARAEEMVRIAVATGLSRVEISGEGLTAEPLREGAAPQPVKDGRARVALEKGELRLDRAPLAAPGVRFRAAGPLRVGEASVEAEVEVRRGAAGLEVIHDLPMERYVAAVLAGEMPLSFPPAALEAQAVAARTYAVGKKIEAEQAGRLWHLGASVLDQVYKGGPLDPRALRAAQATAGEVLAKDHLPVEAYFHSTCGGRTERGQDALGRDLPYLRSVECGRCKEAPKARWTARFDAAELGRAAGLGRPATEARITARTASGRAARVEVSAGSRRVALAAVALRQRLGYERLPSLWFEVERDGRAFRFDGKGSGHGAGMCQWGAAGMAREGAGYRDILAWYYPGTELLRMY
ncbi:SpoIID/LytB domain-containing protein [Anaeromyxobacter paludicola]|uniref:Cell division protein n=1 Tax=Anaeromyxobacter paludicola TaxID=2918171 RepID=A0ABM7X5G1_9BACT|nr:SpoIID/LytB domain-containing protein [Anaeromyxobacter paludicola]BDG07058.1 cell division protein [Anaeromyxobacter paludicola]